MNPQPPLRDGRIHRIPAEIAQVPTPEPIHIISLGAGVQSSTMSLMAACGEITPMPVAAIFADTQAEPASVYRWLDWLEKQLPFPVYRVTRGSLANKALTPGKREDGKSWLNVYIPMWVEAGNGRPSPLTRACTRDFKITPILKLVRKMTGVRGSKIIRAVQWIGISVDEVSRCKDSREVWIKHRWPLIEKNMNRQDCIRWMNLRQFQTPPRSACVFCPYHSDNEWRRLKTHEPEAFAEAVAFEKKFHAVEHLRSGLNRGRAFLHQSCKPLSEVDFSTEEERGQLNMFNSECEGMCGV